MRSHLLYRAFTAGSLAAATTAHPACTIQTSQAELEGTRDLRRPHHDANTSKKLLDPKSKIANYEELGAGFPDQKVSFFTPGTESGTYDYFTEAVRRAAHEGRPDPRATHEGQGQPRRRHARRGARELRAARSAGNIAKLVPLSGHEPPNRV